MDVGFYVCSSGYGMDAKKSVVQKCKRKGVWDYAQCFCFCAPFFGCLSLSAISFPFNFPLSSAVLCSWGILAFLFLLWNLYNNSNNNCRKTWQQYRNAGCKGCRKCTHLELSTIKREALGVCFHILCESFTLPASDPFAYRYGRNEIRYIKKTKKKRTNQWNTKKSCLYAAIRSHRRQYTYTNICAVFLYCN